MSRPDLDLTRMQEVATRIRDWAQAGAMLGVLGLADRLGILRFLADGEPVSVEAVAAAVEAHPAQVREVCRALTAGGILLQNKTTGAVELPIEHAAFVGEVRSPLLAVGWARLIPGLLAALPAVAEGARSGKGAGFTDFGTTVVEGFDLLNGPAFRALLPRWLEHVSGLPERLREPGTHIVDVGCGAGSAARSLAAAFGDSEVHALDADPAAIESAQSQQTAENLTFACDDATTFELKAPAELALMLGVLHNVPDPVAALKNVKRNLTPTGVLFLMQPAGPEANADRVEASDAMLYALSALYAVPISLAQGGGAEGAALSLDRIEHLLEAAGFARAEVVPIAHGLNVFIAAYAT